MQSSLPRIVLSKCSPRISSTPARPLATASLSSYTSTGSPRHSRSIGHRVRNMATPQIVRVTTSDSGVYSAGPKEDAAKTASELLQDDLKRHHVFFNDMHFHSKLSCSIRGSSLGLVRRQAADLIDHRSPCTSCSEHVCARCRAGGDQGRVR